MKRNSLRRIGAILCTCALLTGFLMGELSFSRILSRTSSRAFLRADDDGSGNEPSETVTHSGDQLTPNEDLLDSDPVNAPVPHAHAYLIYDTLSDTMLIGNEYSSPRQPAAITQIMTVLLALEELQPSDTITITKEMYEPIPDEYVRIGFTEGETVTVEQCIYASLLKSANDACLALAIRISGSEKEFVKKMNVRAQELGCTNTHFTNCYGLTDADHRTTCHDMCLILKQALLHPEFQSYATSASFTIDPTNKFNDKRVLNNANRYISTPSTSYEYYIGGKTGYSDMAGYTIIAGAEKEGRRLIGILMGADNAETRYEVLASLFDYCFTNYTTTMVYPSEFEGAVNQCTAKINDAIKDTNLVISESRIEHLEYYSTFFELANSGYSTEVDLSSLAIDPKKTNQSFRLPILRRFANNETYTVGYLVITIVDKDMPVQQAEKADQKEKTSLQNKILTTLVILLLCTVLILILIFFVKLLKKRRADKNHRNPTIL